MPNVDVILKSKIGHLGAEADIVSVRPGYARNFLIPQDLAAPATLATKKQIENLKRKRAEREAKELNDAQEIAGKLGKMRFTFALSSGEGSEKAFGSVTSQDISQRLADQGHIIDRRKIDLPRDIKSTGEHEVGIHLGHGVVGKIKVIVEYKTVEAAPEEDVKDKDKGKVRTKRPAAKTKES
jgi:large subunit ribosomal protein L9